MKTSPAFGVAMALATACAFALAATYAFIFIRRPAADAPLRPVPTTPEGKAVMQYEDAVRAAIASKTDADADAAMRMIIRAEECLSSLGARASKPPVSAIADTKEKRDAYEYFNSRTSWRAYEIPPSDQGRNGCDYAAGDAATTTRNESY